MSVSAQTRPGRVGAASHWRIALAMVGIPTLGMATALVLAFRDHGISALALWLFGITYFLSVVGVEVGFHRYFSHRAFKCRPALRMVLGILGSTAGEGPVLFWVATHRGHHRHADREGDPHAPMPSGLAGFWRAHTGWLFEPIRYDAGGAAPDLIRDPTTMRVHRLYLIWLGLGVAIPAAIGFAIGGPRGAVDGLLWGGLARMFVVHQMTWCINSLCHLFGARPYDTPDRSRNLGILALFTCGGSWHNNHHHYPLAASNTERWWQIDPGGLLILAMSRAGLAWDTRRRPEDGRISRPAHEGARNMPIAIKAAIETEPVPGRPQRIAVPLPPAGRRTVFVIAGAVVLLPQFGAITAVMLAFVYSFDGFALGAFAIAYCLSTLGLTIGFHRHFAHRSFRTSRAMQAVLIAIGSMGIQGPLIYWVSTHRRHHRFSDQAGDPHSPHRDGTSRLHGLTGFWHAHIGWMFANEATNALLFSPDVMGDKFIYKTQNHYWTWAGIGLALPAAAGYLYGGWYIALTTFLWAGPVRLVLVHHASWAVGSLAHMYGRRPFATGDRSANNFLVALLAFGEGLQNNHHAFPTAARHAFHWYEPDLSGLVIAGLARLGLIWNLHEPAPEMLASRRTNAPDGTTRRT